MKIFKKLSVLLLSFLLMVLLWPPRILGAETADQYCSITDDSYNLYLHLHSDVYQTFKPTLNRLTQVAVIISAQNSGGTITLNVKKDTQVLATDSRSITSGAKQTIYFNSFSDLTVTPAQTYKIQLSVSGTETTVWNASNAYSGCYSGGEGFSDGAPIGAGRDFDFTTFGYNQETPAPQPPGDNGDTDQDNNGEQAGVDTSTNYGAAPAAITSTDIKAPTNLKAANTPSKDKPAVTLTWTKSATDKIDGYKVFRKEAGKDYGQIAQTEKTVVKFIDNNVTDGAKYTYMIRAYKGDAQSENSNEATITVSKKATKKSSSIISSFGDLISWKDPIFLAFFGAAAVAALGFLLWHLIWRRKNQEAITKKKNPFENR